MSEIYNTADFLDSREIQERIEELEKEGVNEPGQITEEWEELRKLKKLKELYIEDYNENSWGWGAFFIRDDYMETYAREKPGDWFRDYDENRWPFNHIDWEEATEAFKQDYTEIDFDGVIYWTQEA